MAGIDGAQIVPHLRWDHEQYYASDPLKDPMGQWKTHCNHGCFIEGLELFDNKMFKISPMEAQGMDPNQRQALEVFYETTMSAGIDDKKLMRSNIGVFMGGTGGVVSEFGQVPKDDVGGALGSTSGSAAIMANRISFCMGIHGPNFFIDLEGAASLTAFNLAVDSVQRDKAQCIAAVALGVDCNVHPQGLLPLGWAGLLSKKGRCLSFDSYADGYIRGEGYTGLYVSPLMKEENGKKMIDEDPPIIALASGTFINNNGRSASLTAPSGAMYQELVANCVRSADLSPLDVDAVECHATGNVLADAVEARHTIHCHPRANFARILRQAPKARIRQLLRAMPVGGLLSAAALAGVGQTIWQYNRENYMFDVPLRQARDFQVQNVNLARYALFREDIRDLASLTTDKVSNLLVVNTLKVGFIVALYFNFDRTDTGYQDRSLNEDILSVLFGMTLLTSFFFLMTSIWFAMHALQLAQAITTKLLVQVVRIPLPSEFDIAAAASEGRDFEMNFREALRVPFIEENQAKPGSPNPPQPEKEASPVRSRTQRFSTKLNTLTSAVRDKVADALYAQAVRWTVEDMRCEETPSLQLHDVWWKYNLKTAVDGSRSDMARLATYGGEPVSGVRSFLFQFENTSEKHDHFMPSADHLFKVAMALVSLFWVLALLWSVWFSADVFSKMSLDGARKVFQLQQPWRNARSFGCTLEGEHYVITDGYDVQILNGNGSVFLQIHDACGPDGGTSRPVMAVDFGQRAGELVVACSSGTKAIWVRDKAVLSSEWSSNLSDLEAVAVDRTPLEEDADHLDALALRKGELLGIRFHPAPSWRLYGALTTPPLKGNVAAVAIRLGRALVLTQQDELFELDVPSGIWAGPMRLPSADGDFNYDWIALCRLTHGRWRFLGLPEMQPMQLWHFERPPANALPPRRDETAAEWRRYEFPLANATALTRAYRALAMDQDTEEEMLGLLAGKTNVGNMRPAMGCAALLRVIVGQAMGCMPPSLHLHKLNPHVVQADDVPSFFVTEHVQHRMTAAFVACTASGIGGSNAHTILWGRACTRQMKMEKPVKAEDIRLTRSERERILHPAEARAQSTAKVQGPHAYGQVAPFGWVIDTRPGSGDADRPRVDVGQPGDQFQVQLQIKGRFRAVTWERLDTQNVQRNGLPKTMGRYFIVGSWNDWQPEEMTLEDEGVGRFSIKATMPKGNQRFQILRNRDWRQLIYPETCYADCDSVVKGPDANGHDRYWNIEVSASRNVMLIDLDLWDEDQAYSRGGSKSSRSSVSNMKVSWRGIGKQDLTEQDPLVGAPHILETQVAWIACGLTNNLHLHDVHYVVPK
ncbi:unnamed protein product [Effrenium voratum]|nr:unnamed protein product [Effrenium voratum]